MSYLPTTDSELKAFAENFAARITAAPATYGLVAGDATSIQAASDDYTARYNLAISPATRTAGAIDNKNVAKTTLMAIVRGYAMEIKSNRAVSNQAKIELGIGVYDLVRNPTPTPTSFPVLKPEVSAPRQHLLSITDAVTDKKAARPGRRG